MVFKNTPLTENDLGLIYQLIKKNIKEQSEEVTTEPLEDYTSEEIESIRKNLTLDLQLKIFAQHFLNYILEEYDLLVRICYDAGIENVIALTNFVRESATNYANRAVEKFNKIED